MSSPAHRTLRPLGRSVSEAGPASGFDGLTRTERPASRPGEWPLAKSPETPGATYPPPGGRTASAVLRITCSGEGFARARSFARDTLCGWSLGHRADDAVLVITELASNAVVHAAPAVAPDVPEIGLGLVRHPGHVMLTVSDPGDTMPAFAPSDGSALQEGGRGLCIVDALAEEWGWTPRLPAGKTVWAKLSTRSHT